MVLVGLHVLQCVLRRAEAVHQQKTDCRPRLLTQMNDLMRDDIEKGRLPFDRKQALGFFQSHTRAEPAIELDHHRLRQQGWVKHLITR